MVSVIWGGSFIAAKVALAELTPVALATLRFGLAGAFFLGLVLVRPEYRARTQSIPRLAFFGLLAVTFYFILQYGGVERTSASLSAIIITLSPLVVVLLSAIFLGERIGLVNVAGIGLATAGALILVSRGAVEVGGSEYWLGVFFLVLDVIFWGIYNVIGKRTLMAERPTTLTAYMMMLGAVGLVPFAIADGGLSALPYLSSQVWMSVAYLVLLSTIVAYLAYNFALQMLPASRAGVYQYLNPVAAVFFSHLLLSEPAGLLMVLGGLMSIGGVYLATRR
jgi:drug/metabolite transporter (DMT)-like permease